MDCTGILLFVFRAALQCIICRTRALQISNYVSILCCRGMESLGLHEEELTNLIKCCSKTKCNTYISKGRDGHLAHEKIGMGEVKIHSVLLRDWLIFRYTSFWSCCCGIDCFGSTFFLALGWHQKYKLSRESRFC